MSGEADRRERIMAALARYEARRDPDRLRHVKRKKLTRKGGNYETSGENESQES